MSGAGDGKPMQIDMRQLQMAIQQLDQTIEEYRSAGMRLKMVQSQFVDSKRSLELMKPETKDKDIMMPLTTSLYVPGQLHDTERVIVEVGTGYYIEQGVPAAIGFFDRRVDELTTTIGNIQRIAMGKLKEKSELESLYSRAMEARQKADAAKAQAP